MIKPFAIGASMAAMMLWMLHDRLMAGESDLTAAAVAFILAHVAVVVALACLALFLPRIRTVVLKHRPSMGHFAGMLLGMIVSAGVIHLVMHGTIL
jgi:hypothetical protein